MTESAADYLIDGGLVVSGAGVTRRDVLVRNGLILEVGPDLSGRPSKRVVDASGKYVLPGIIDAHNHPVNTDKIDTFSISAAFGGITTVIPFIQNLRRGQYELGVSAINQRLRVAAAFDELAAAI